MLVDLMVTVPLKNICSIRQGSVSIIFIAVPPDPGTMLAYGRASINI